MVNLAQGAVTREQAAGYCYVDQVLVHMAISRLGSEEGGKTGVFGANGGWLIRGMLVCANIITIFVSSLPPPHFVPLSVDA